MHNPDWFDRRFDFTFDADYEAIRSRLEFAPGEIRHALLRVPEEVMIYQPDGKWSIKEHVGHLSVLEPLWRTRIDEITASKPVLTPADLGNRATAEAGFIGQEMVSLLGKLDKERDETLALLDGLQPSDREKSSLHPRLNQQMRIVDLAFFVAEHDQHHLAVIRRIIDLFP
jgi:uncharacterized damage-inducible protein DinB